MIIVMKIPDNQDILLKLDAAKLLIPMTKGEIFDFVACGLRVWESVYLVV
jgi:hypothetical protein